MTESQTTRWFRHNEPWLVLVGGIAFCVAAIWSHL